VRKDLGGERIAAKPKNFSTTFYATSISSDNASVQTTEHLMAALYCLRLDNVEIHIDGPELPIMDGSAAPFIYMLHEAGIKMQTRPKNVIRIIRPVKITDGEKSIAIYPSDALRITYTIEFEHPLIGRQSKSMVINEDSFVDEIAPARTFGFLKDVEMLRRNGLAMGGSTENAIVIGDNSILNPNLRYVDEFVRHKILDAIGDVAYTGCQIQGHIVAKKAGHTLHIELVKKLLANNDAYELGKAIAPEETEVHEPAYVPGSLYS
jgi:UDP-3-O-[3-hydroxymyristoyl] N-acetylglucosamine deacetylase